MLAWRGRVWCVRRLRGVVCAGGVGGSAGEGVAPPAALESLPQLLQTQYEHEEPALRIGTHLLHTHYLKVSVHHLKQVLTITSELKRLYPTRILGNGTC